MHLKSRAAFVTLSLAVLLLVISFRQLSVLQAPNFNHRLSPALGARSYVSVRTVNQQEDPAALNIDVGVRVRTIHSVNLPEQTFESEGWLWMQWGEDVQALIERYDIAKDGIVEIVNAVDQDSAIYSPGEVVVRERNGKRSYFLGISYSSVRLFVPSFDLRNSPFSPLVLPIIFEASEALAMDSTRVALRPEMNTNSDPVAGEFAGIGGFSLASTSWQRGIATYLSPPDAPTGSQRVFSRVTALLVYAPGFWSIFVQWILPLLVVMGIVVMTPSLDGALGDSRLAIPTAALLTLIFLHLGYKNSFPDPQYLTYLDLLYAYSYAVCIVIYVLFVMASNAHSRGSREGGNSEFVRRHDRLESIVQVSVLAGYGCVAVLGWQF